VPNRLNYILWLQDLLDSTSESYDDQYHADREVTGLDIGTGASCIYPLLGCKSRPKWRFVATDIDAKNLEYARRNVTSNNLETRIRPMPTKSDSPLVPLNDIGLRNIDFTMCNPPFYASDSEMLESAKAKSRPPRSACTGAEVEMVTPGGEVAFVSRMIDESVVLRDRVQWYSSMLGKLSSLNILVEKLKLMGVNNWAATEFVQGGKTRRWALAWSWETMRPNLVSSGALALTLNTDPWYRSLRGAKEACQRSCYPFHQRPT
jgi:23S rRNA (adenine1618-N6)-methyltransferase